MVSIWGIITARKDSQRLKKKNIRKLINKPLIEWTFHATKNTNLDRVILSTNCDECINLSEKFPHIEIPFKRNESLSQSSSKSLDVIRDCLFFFQKKQIPLPDFVFILQPTSPQRNGADINKIIDIVKKNPMMNGITTMSQLNNNLEKMYVKNDTTICPLNGIGKSTEPNSNLICENGFGFIVKTTTLLKSREKENVIGSIPYDNIKNIIYPESRIVVDIDTLEDFEYAEYLLKQESSKVVRNEIKIGNRTIHEYSKPFVIAEIGINHECSMVKAKKMIYDAFYSGCECVKFQCHIPHEEMTDHAKDIVPSNANEDIYSIVQKSSLTEEQEIELKGLVEELGMIYLCTPFSIEAANRLERMGIQAFKIGSGEMNNLQLIEHVAQFGKPMLVSTGMNSLDRIKTTVNLIEKYMVPYCLFHCVSIYPTPYDKVNLPGVDDLKYEFPNAIIGLSDHSIGITSCLGAYMKGCQIFEKHYTSYKEWEGPDIEISITPNELKDLIQQLNILSDCCKGNGRHIIQKEEQGTIDFAFCTLTSTKDLQEGHILEKADFIAKRPNIGDFLSEDIPHLIGKQISTNIKKNDKFFKQNIVF